jgi:hypothetical protein
MAQMRMPSIDAAAHGARRSLYSAVEFIIHAGADNPHRPQRAKDARAFGRDRKHDTVSVRDVCVSAMIFSTPRCAKDT